MKNIYTYTLLTLFIIPFSIKSQTIGYMGKKNSIDIGAMVVPSFTNFAFVLNSVYYSSSYDYGDALRINGNSIDIIDTTDNNKRYSLSKISIKVYPEVNISRTVSRNLDISLRVGYQTFTMYYSPERFDHTYSTPYGIRSDELLLIKNKQVSKGQAFIYELNFRYNLRQFIAPVGPYINFGIGIYRTHLMDEEETLTGNMYDNYNSSYTYSTGEITLKNEWIKMKRISMGLHMKKIVGNYFYLDSGIEMSLMFGAGQYKLAEYSNSTTDIEDKYISNMQKRYLNWENLMTLKFSIGRMF